MLSMILTTFLASVCVRLRHSLTFFSSRNLLGLGRKGRQMDAKCMFSLFWSIIVGMIINSISRAFSFQVKLASDTSFFHVVAHDNFSNNLSRFWLSFFCPKECFLRRHVWNFYFGWIMKKSLLNQPRKVVCILCSWISDFRFCMLNYLGTSELLVTCRSTLSFIYKNVFFVELCLWVFYFVTLFML